MSWYWPALLLLVPMAGAILVALAPARQAKWIALGATTATFAHSVILGLAFDRWEKGGFGLEATVPWIGAESIGVAFSFGADAVAMLLVLLTTLLMPLCVWGSFSAITNRVKEYYGWMLAIEAAMVGVFIARDLVFFYICFEFTLVPMYFLIAIWGSEDRARACTKFFLYTFTGSVIALAGLLYVAWQNAQSAADLADGAGRLRWSFDIQTLTAFASSQLSPAEQAWVLAALLAGFAVKVPLFPLHTWLPLAHTEAPAAGSVILAGVLLKLGTYGLYRFVLPMVPAAVVRYAPEIAVVAIIGILYASLICWVQSDLKRLVAYSSVSHLGFCVLGLIALNPLGAQGSVLYMINHGLSTGALFFLVGMIYERYHTRDLQKVGGLAARMPVWAFFMVFFAMSSVGLPGLNGFVGEFLCLVGTFTAGATADPRTGGLLESYPGRLGPWYATAAAAGMILAAMYLLIMVGKLVFGPLREPAAHEPAHGERLPADLGFREIGVLAPLAVLCLAIGLQPKPMTDAISGSVKDLLAGYPATVQLQLAGQNPPRWAEAQPPTATGHRRAPGTVPLGTLGPGRTPGPRFREAWTPSIRPEQEGDSPHFRDGNGDSPRQDAEHKP